MENEAVRLLSEYLRIDTTNPPGNEKRSAEFFAKIFDHEGIEYKLYEPKPGKSSIRACLRGAGKKGAVILLNHMDVVPANADEWSFDPFGGDVREGLVCRPGCSGHERARDHGTTGFSLSETKRGGSHT